MFNFLKSTYLLAVFVTFIVSMNAFAVPNTLTFQSKIFKPDGTALDAASVNFRFTSLDPTGTCILYVEDFNSVSMQNSGGLVIFNLGNGSKTYPVGPFTFTNIFDNLQPSFICQGGGSYTPAVSHLDGRRVILQFNDSSGSGWQTLPAVDISSVPFANFAGNSEKLAGYLASDFLRTSTLPTCTGSDVLTFNGTSLSCVPTSGGTVSSVGAAPTAGNPLVITGPAATPKVDIPAATAAVNGYLAAADFTLFAAKAATASPTFTGVPVAPTAAVDTNTTQLATTAFVIAQAGTLSPLMNNAVSVGTSTRFSREDHVHPVDTSRSPLAGSASLVTTGTITTGTWNGTAIGATYGGTGQTSYAIGDLLYASGASALSKLAAGANGFVLKSNGPGTAPSWTAASTGTVTSVTPAATAGNPLTIATGTSTPVIDIPAATAAVNGYLSAADFTTFTAKQAGSSELSGLAGLNTLGFVKRTAANTYTTAAVSLTADVSGILPVANGGTGVNTIPSGNLVVGNTAGAVNSLAAGAAGNVIYGTGAATFASATPDTAGLVDKASVQAISGAKIFGATLKISNQNLLTLGDTGTNGVSFSAPAAVTSSYTLTWPSALPASNKVLQSDSLGNLTFVSAALGDALVANPLSQFASTTSAQLAGVLSDETGTGVAVFGTAPTFTTNLTSPMIIGGTATTSTLTYKTTTAAGVAGADHIFQVGNNGSQEAMRILNSGYVGIGTTNPGAKLQIDAATTTAKASIFKTTDNNTTNNLTEWQNSSGTILGSMTADGRFSTSGAIDAGVNLQMVSTTSVGGKMRLGQASGSVGFDFTTTAPFGALTISRLNAGGDLTITSPTRINGNLGLGLTATAKLHLPAGTIAAGTSPLKFEPTSATLMTAPENGAMEFDGTDYYLTAGGTRNKIATGTAGAGSFVAKAGDTMTGALVNNTNSASTALAVTQAGAGYAATIMGGNVGIGTTLPEAKLHIAGEVLLNNNNALQAKDTSGTARSLLQLDNGNNLHLTNNAGNVFVHTAAAGNFQIQNNAQTVANLIVLETGNVGIGTTGPNTALDINGAESMRGMAAPALSIAGQGRIYFDSTSNTYKVSQNNGAYSDLATTASVGTSYVAKDGDTMVGSLAINGSTDAVQFSVRANAAQTTNLQEWKNSSNAILSSVNSAGKIGVGIVADSGVDLQVRNGGTFRIGQAAGSSGYDFTSSGANLTIQRLNAGGALAINSPVSMGVGGGSLSVGVGTTISAPTTTNVVSIIKTTDDNTTKNITEWQNSSGIAMTVVNAAGNVGIGTTNPTAKLTLASSDGTVGKAPLKFTSGTSLATPEVGAVEYDGTNLFYTDGTATRRTIATSVAGGYVAKAGDTMTGNLLINSNSASADLSVTQSGAGPAATFMGGNVGIGTTSPNTLLHVEGSNPVLKVKSNVTSASDTPTLSLLGNSGSPLIIQNDNWNGLSIFDFPANQLQFRYAGTEKMRLESTGDLSIGQAGALGSRLAVSKSSTVNVATFAGNTLTGSLVNIAGADTDSTAYNLFKAANATSTKMIIRNDGNVGIGTTTPTAKLEINGSGSLLRFGYSGASTAVSADPWGGIAFGGDNAENGYSFNSNNGGFTVNTNSNGKIKFRTSNGDRLVIDGQNNGNVGIGTAAPTAKFHLPAGTIAAGTSPLKFEPTAATLMTTPENGAMEFDGTNYYLTAGGTRKMVAYSSAGSTTWNLTGNSGTTAGTNFIGTTDDIDVVFKRNGVQSGLLNSASSNTSWGVNALNSASTGTQNTATGRYALSSNTTGAANTAIGYNALLQNTTGNYNVAIGTDALYTSTTAIGNIAIGREALTFNTGNLNTAIGYQASISNTTGTINSSFGWGALSANTTGIQNSAYGSKALLNMTSGSNNIAVGYLSAQKQADGTTNLTTANNSIYIGANTRGFNNSDSNSIVIGDSAIGIGANSVVLGNNSITTTALKGNVGIGTTAPAVLLDLAGTTGINYVPSAGGNPVFTTNYGGFVGTGGATIGAGGIHGQIITLTPRNASNWSQIASGGSAGLLLGNSTYLVGSNVGIGTTTPTAKLHLPAGTLAAGTSPLKFETTAAALMTTPENGAMEFDGTDYYLTSSGTRNKIATSSAGAGSFVAKAGDTMTGALVNNTNSASTALAVTQSGAGYAATIMGGNVGIGNTTPGAKLDVSGNIAVGGVGGTTFQSTETGYYIGAKSAQNTGFHIYTDTSDNAFIRYGIGSGKVLTLGDGLSTQNHAFTAGTYTIGSDVSIGRVAANNLAFGTAGSERLRIDQAGNVGIGTTTPAAKLDSAYVLLSGTGAGTYTALRGKAYTNGGTSTNTSLVGVDGYVGSNNTTVTIPSAIAVKGTQPDGTTNENNATFTDLYSFYASGPALDSGTATRSTGIYIESMKNAGVGTGYGIYQNGSNDINYFAGNVGIGTTAPNTALDINGAASMRGIAAPALSVAGQGRIYFDSTSNTYKVSQNNGAYSDLATTASIGTSYVAKAGDTMTGALVNNTNSASTALAVTQSGAGYAATIMGGNVGIGTMTPSSALHLHGTNVLDTPRGDIILSRYWNNSTDTRASAIFHIFDSVGANDLLAFGVSSSSAPNQLSQAKMVISTTGVGIGNTNPGSAALAVTGNVGIGTNAPIRPLHLKSSGGSIEQVFEVTGAGTNNNKWRFLSSGSSFKLETVDDAFTTSTSAMTITRNANAIDAVVFPNSNVGIGTTAPTAKLHLPAGTIAAGTSPLKFQPTSATLMTTPENGAMEFDGTDYYLTAGGTRNKIATSSAGAGSFVAKSGDTMTGALVNNTNSASTALAIAQSGTGYAATFSGGNVGIGILAPTTKLHVEGPGSNTNSGVLGTFGSGTATSGNLYSIAVDKNGTDTVYLGVNKNTVTGSVPANAVFLSSYQTNSSISIGRGGGAGNPSSSDIFISSTGTVGIGTTGPTAQLEVNNSSGATMKVSDSGNSFDIRSSGGSVGLSRTGTQFMYVGGENHPIFDRPTGVGSGSRGLLIGNGAYGGSGNATFGASAEAANQVPVVMRGFASQTADLLQIQNSTNTSLVTVNNIGNVGIGVLSPTAKLHLPAGTIAAGTSPLKFEPTSATLMTAPENGAMEFDGTDYYLTAGGTRKKVAYSGAGSSAWGLTGNAGTTAGTNFVGTTDNVDVVFKRNGVQSGLLNAALFNTSWGVGALSPTTSGTNNVAAGYNALTANTSGDGNVASGYLALTANTTGGGNVALGQNALKSNTVGANNTAIGNGALLSYNRSTGGAHDHTAIGGGALTSLTDGYENTAIGNNALGAATNIAGSTAIGAYTLYNSTSSGNTAIGHYTAANVGAASGVTAIGQGAGRFQTGSNNTSLGGAALSGAAGVSTGSSNTGLGFYALKANTTGSNNAALGYSAGQFQADGSTDLTTANNSVYIGASTKGLNNSDSNSIVIGYNAIGIGANTVVLGNSSIATTALRGNVGIGTTGPLDTLSLGAVNASATRASINLSNTALSGGSASGTYIGANPAASGADLINYQVNGVLKFKVDAAGVVTSTATVNGSSSYTNSVTTPIIYGGANASDNLTLYSTQHATKGYVNIAPDGGNVGIGTTAPAAKLDVYGSSRISASNLVFSEENVYTRTFAGTAVGSYIEVANFNTVNNQGTFGLEVDVVGYNGSGDHSKKFVIYGNYGDMNAVGWREVIPVFNTGTSAGDYTLDIGGNAVSIGSQLTLRLRVTSLLTGAETVFVRVKSLTSTTVSSLSGTGSVAAPGVYFRNSSLTQVLGNVGIGTTNPVNKLDVSGAIGFVDFLYNINNTAVLAMNNNKFTFSPNGSPTVVFEGAGNVGIGLTNPSTKLQVAGIIAPEADATRDLGTSSLRFKDIYASNAVIQTSDARMKKDIQLSDLGLDFIVKLRPVSYYWKEGTDEKLHYGLIAQETKKAITDEKQKSGRASEVDNVIVSHDDKTDRYGVRYSELISPIIKAIQDLYSKLLGAEGHQYTQDREIASVKASKADKTETDALKAENEKLKQENAAIKARLDKIEKMLNSK